MATAQQAPVAPAQAPRPQVPASTPSTASGTKKPQVPVFTDYASI